MSKLSEIGKRELELLYVTQLVREIGVDFSSIENALPPRPDIAITTNGKIVGVEVTELVGGPDRVTESEHSLIVSLACEKYIAAGGVPLNVAVRFGANAVFKRDREVVAEWIAAYLIANMPADNEFTEWRFSNSRSGQYPSCLASFTAFRLKGGKENSWRTNLSGFVNSYLQDTIVEAIEKKEKILKSRYENECSECWLLLVADWKRSSSFIELTSTDLPPSLPMHSFARIYLHSVYSSEPWVRLA